MSTESPLTRVQNGPRANRVIVVVGLLTLMFLLGVSSVLFAPQGTTVAAWWPAAGLSVLVVLAARPGRRGRLIAAAAVWAVSAGSNIAAGRPLAVAVCFGFANAAEAWVVASIVEGNGRSATLDSVRQVGVFVSAVIVGAVTIGTLAGLTVWIFMGGDPIAVLAGVAPSHASAVLVIVPMALVRRIRLDRALRTERLLQVALLLVVLGVVFYPGQSLPLAFLPLPVLTWAALRFGIRFVTWEVFGTALVTSLLTTGGGGPFVQADPTRAGISVVLLQVFLSVYAGSILFTAAGRVEADRLADQLSAREQLLRSGLVGAQIGFLILEADSAGAVRVIEGNEMAGRLLGIDVANFSGANSRLQTDGDFPRALLRLRRAGDRQHEELELVAGSHQLQVFIARVSSERNSSLFTVQVIDITEQREAELVVQTALIREREVTHQLRDLNRQKDDFVSSVSHELRTPITSILGFAEELEDSDLEPEQANFTRVIARNSRRLAYLVEDLLELSRMSAGNTFLTRDVAEDVDLSRLLTEAVEDLQPIAAAKSVALVSDLDPAGVTLAAIPQHLTRIAINLVSNAVKFTPGGGHVTVSSTHTDASVTIVVDDDGVGIPPAEIDRVLERFYRASSSASMPGTGLGLALVKGLVDRLHGTLEIASDGVRGTRVTVTLPRVGQPEHADAVGVGAASPRPTQ